MKGLKPVIKTIAWFLTALVLFQSCVVYHKTPTTLEKASREQTKTKITNTNGELFKYGYITYEDGIYYGINKKSGELVKTTLDQEYINKVVTKNKSASTWVTVGVIGVPVLFLVIGGIIASNNVGLEGGAWGYN